MKIEKQLGPRYSPFLLLLPPLWSHESTLVSFSAPGVLPQVSFPAGWLATHLASCFWECLSITFIDGCFHWRWDSGGLHFFEPWNHWLFCCHLILCFLMKTVKTFYTVTHTEGEEWLECLHSYFKVILVFGFSSLILIYVSMTFSEFVLFGAHLVAWMCCFLFWQICDMLAIIFSPRSSSLEFWWHKCWAFICICPTGLCLCLGFSVLFSWFLRMDSFY